MYAFSLMILLIWEVPLCPMVSLAKGLSIINFLKELAPGFVDSLCSSFHFYLVDFVQTQV